MLMRLPTSDLSVHSIFKRAKKLEKGYRSQLRRLARHIGDIARAHDAETPAGCERIRLGLMAYSLRIGDWADSVANRMIEEVAAADRESWRKSSALVGRLLHKEIDNAPTGLVLKEALERQVDLITSLPVEAARRVHKLTLEGMTQGRRTSEIAADIRNSGEVASSRADLIARTEVSRTATELTKARAEHIGSTHYIWRTVHDGSVRASHRKLDGKVFRWDDPPECDPGHRSLPGAIWNCRCFPEPLITGDND